MSLAAFVASSHLIAPASAWSSDAVQAPADRVRAGFLSPPNSARPRVWWHWMNGNVTKDGIRKDLEWMARVGIGGLQNFDAALSTPQVVPERLAYMTPAWKDAFHYAAELADKLGLELAIAASPGWSETGGPWVAPKDGMKKLVWSETFLSGGRPFAGQLRVPPSVTGPYQDLPKDDALGALLGSKSAAPPTYYQDVAVLALPVAKAGPSPAPRLHSISGDIPDASRLDDDSLETGIELDKGTAQAPGYVAIDYGVPRTIRSATLFIPGYGFVLSRPDFIPKLQVSDDKQGWRTIADFPLSGVPTTVSFAPVTSSRFRIVFEPFQAQGGILLVPTPGTVLTSVGPPAEPQKTVKITDLRLSDQARVNRFESKAGFSLVNDYYALDGNVGPDAQGIAPGSIIDVTDSLRPDGRLDWTPPRGKWKVVRFGYSLTGTTNHPATAEATGLEVDKYDGAAVRAYIDTYLKMYADAVGSGLIGKRGLRAMVTDSIEAGASNWTPEFRTQFQRLRGYNPRPWMPALTGAIVGSRRQSDAFLYDFRRTLADLIASEHYGVVAEAAHAQGVVVYGEALEGGRPLLGDDMAMRSHADIPMAAMWTFPRDARPHSPALYGDMKGAASVAHVYGQNLVAAESLTSALSPWALAPADLKRIIDLEFAYGINRPVIHTSVHQPLDDKFPGLRLMVFGQDFNRHESWAEMAGAWVDYISRSSYMLQQGRYFADVAYFYGEEAPLTGLFQAGQVTDTPVRYGYDFVNDDVVLNRLAVQDGELVAASGARYRVLYLGGSSKRMTLRLLRRLAQLAEAGATIVGDAPEGSPGLQDDPSEYAALVRKLWSGNPATVVGKGRVIAGKNVEAALGTIGILPDFELAKPAGESELLFLHRRLADGDVYFVSNRKDRPETVEARFRVTGKKPEIWRADTGQVEPGSYTIEGGRTVVPLEMQADEALFIVFREPAAAASQIVPRIDWRAIGGLNGPWEVSFQPGRGAPPSARLDTLASLSESKDEGIRYFSGTATYTKTFQLPRGWAVGSPLMLDLGKVGDLAEIRINGELVGAAWKPPYRIDISKAVRRGTNSLEIRVANLWVNRLIGDAQPNVRKITFTTLPTYRADASLRPSGLIGPVTLLAAQAR